MKTKNKVMFFGTGDLTFKVMQVLFRSPNLQMVLVGKDKEKATRMANLAGLTALQLGYDVDIEAAEADMRSSDQVSDVITLFRPDVVFNGASLQSWRRITELPKSVFQSLDEAQLGPWLPMHLALTHKLMVGVVASGVKPLVVNSAYPDAVNPLLSKYGLAPDIGVGNVCNLIPALRRAAASQLETPVRQIDVKFIAHHYVSHYVPRFGEPDGVPYHLTVNVQSRDVTSDCDLRKLFDDVRTKFRRMGGLEGQSLTAAFAATVIEGLLSDEDVTTHAPGPLGLPGGYPVRLRRRTVALDLPPGVSLPTAVHINEVAQSADGIKSIGADGTARFTEACSAVMRKMLKYDCPPVDVDNALGLASEIEGRYSVFVSSLAR